jgi:uncharacterized Ntn-hydrolase superfamily protein
MSAVDGLRSAGGLARDRARTRVLSRALLAALAAFTFSSEVSATWSIIAVDKSTRTVVVSSAACVPQVRFANFPARDLMDIQAIVAPGKGVAVAQAAVDHTRANQKLIFDELQKGTPPAEIVKLLLADPDIQSRQFAILDVTGSSAGFTGQRNQPVAIDRQDVAGDNIVFSIQGNNVASLEGITLALQTFKQSTGTLADRVMSAMEAVDSKGGDKRCTCATGVPPVEGKDPLQGVPCDAKTAHVAYILAAEPTDANGSSFSDGTYSMYISVTDQNLTRKETQNPVRTLRRRYDAWVKANPPK